MDERIIIRHLNGRKANQTDEFLVKDTREITVGRDADCQLLYDSYRESPVSRRHAKITVDNVDPLETAIADLGSSNGTFVNKQRISGKMRISPGDIIQLGSGGPEFQFDLDPRPAAVKPTRNAGVGKATVERLIAHDKNQARKTMLVTGLAVLVIVAGIFGYVLTRPKPHPTIITNTTIAKRGPTGMSSAQIAAANTPAAVAIEVIWSLIDANNGRVLSQVCFPNARRKRGKMVPIVPNAGKTLPVFFSMNGTLEPILSTDDGGGMYLPIGESERGSGFVVSHDGFILTNRHVALGWETDFTIWRLHQIPAGIVLSPGPKGLQMRVISLDQFPPNWVPSHAKIVFEGKLDMNNYREVRNPLGFAKPVQGRNDALNVAFAGNRIRVPAKVARSSDITDVAMIKVDLPRSLPKVELNDNYDTIQPGAEIVVMGYPGVSPRLVQVTNSVDPHNGGKVAETLPTPTVSDGNVGKILRNGPKNTGEAGTYSEIGDFYQLQLSTTGAGNSGGPVFDDQGKVIGIFTLSTGPGADAAMRFAVPIRYGMELMGITINSNRTSLPQPTP